MMMLDCQEPPRKPRPAERRRNEGMKTRTITMAIQAAKRGGFGMTAASLRSVARMRYLKRSSSGTDLPSTAARKTRASSSSSSSSGSSGFGPSAAAVFRCFELSVWPRCSARALLSSRLRYASTAPSSDGHPRNFSDSEARCSRVPRTPMKAISACRLIVSLSMKNQLSRKSSRWLSMRLGVASAAQRSSPINAYLTEIVAFLKYTLTSTSLSSTISTSWGW
mmetsp:Transcript_12725/g.32701  ORF Transcript_12725/g.32701 Transcript_12725/m.32701 type:complete len:222 (+) Transcript_12725:1062-1727(+)